MRDWVETWAPKLDDATKDNLRRLFELAEFKPESYIYSVDEVNVGEKGAWFRFKFNNKVQQPLRPAAAHARGAHRSCLVCVCVGVCVVCAGAPVSQPLPSSHSTSYSTAQM